ncbi:unnamed protein product, partial [Prorocentrum cordatum]
MAAGRALARPPSGGPLRGAAAARAAADNLVKRLSKELEEARKECQLLQDAFASAIADGDIGDRVLALVPALSDLVNGRRPLGLRRLRRNVALHAVAEDIDSIATAGGPSLRRAAKGARLDNLVAFREPPVECIVEACCAEVGALLQALAAAAPVCGAHPPDTVHAEGGGAPADLQPVALLKQQEMPPVPLAAAPSLDGSVCADGEVEAELPHVDGTHEGSAVFEVDDGFADSFVFDGRDCESSAELEDEAEDERLLRDLEQFLDDQAEHYELLEDAGAEQHVLDAQRAAVEETSAALE